MNLSQAHWRKSSRTSGSNAQCVEVADLASHIAIRDSKNPERAAHTVTRPAWAAFVDTIKAGHLDRP